MTISEHWDEEKTKHSKVIQRKHDYVVEIYHNGELLGRLPEIRATKAEDLAEEWVLNKLNIQEVF
jgi:hypothetical protein|tara:strand:- start:183 stop:377 length:195 start_codon:yes stop_codon:yes gene_type:complete